MSAVHRRTLLAWLAVSFSGVASAQAAFPSRPLRIVVPNAAGGAADITARTVGHKIAGPLGQSVVIENKPSAGGVVAGDLVARAEPDGHTLLLVSSGTAVSAALFQSLPFDTLKDFVPVSLLATFDLAVVVKEGGRFANLAERKTNLGTQLSGGEQQMLAVGRALVLNPRLLLLDEPLEGLAPIIVEELLRAIRRITREEGLSAIIVEQHPQAILAISDHAAVLDRGTVVHTGSAAELSAQPELLDRLLGVAR